MNFNSTRRKIKKTFERISNSFNNLGVKLNNNLNFSLRTLDLKEPQTIYDSGWIESLPVSGSITPPHDPNKFVLASRSGLGVSEQDVIDRYTIDYTFKIDIDIPEDFLPFLKTTIIAKPPPTVELVSSQVFDYQRWDLISVYEIKGDSTLIFTGKTDEIVPANDRFQLSSEDLDNGASTPSLTSKWYTGTLRYTYLGDNIVLTGQVHRVFAKYDYFINGGGENFTTFETIGISSLSSSSVSGTGIHEKRLWVETAPGVWELQITTIKNVTMSAPFNNLSTITMWGGKTVNGTPSGLSYHTMPAGATVTEWDLTFNDTYRIFYSNKLARVFYMGDYDGVYREPKNLPISTYYETSTNPYSNITFKINKDPLPDPVDDSTTIAASETKHFFKIKETEGITTYRLSQIGTFYCIAPASEPKAQSFRAENEIWNNNGTTYELTGEDRDNKEKDAYFPALLPVQVRLLITVDSKLLINQTEHFKLSPIEL